MIYISSLSPYQNIFQEQRNHAPFLALPFLWEKEHWLYLIWRVKKELPLFFFPQSIFSHDLNQIWRAAFFLLFYLLNKWRMGLLVQDGLGVPMLHLENNNRAQNITTPAHSSSLSPEIVISNGVPVAIVFPDPTEAPSPIPTGATLIVETSEGDFEIVTRNKYATSLEAEKSHHTTQNSVSSSDLETIIRKLVEKIHLDSLQQPSLVEEQSEQNTFKRQLATLIPEPTSTGPSDLLLFPPQQLGPNVVRIPWKGSNVRTLELHINVVAEEDLRVASPTAILAPPVLPTDVPIPTEVPPPFSQVGSNQPFYFLGPPTVVEPNQTKSSSRVLNNDELSRQIGYLVLEQISRHISTQEEPIDDFEKYIIGKESHHTGRLIDATQAPLPTESSQPKQGTTLPLTLSNLPPPPSVVLPNGSLS
jgi:hypothetical protein